MSIGQIEIDASRFNVQACESDLPILPTRNLVLFPGVTLPLSLGRKNSVTTASLASDRAIPIGIVCQVDPDDENPSVSTGLYKYGVIADVMKVLELPDGSKTALVRAREKFRIMGRGKGVTMPEAELSARIKIIKETSSSTNPDFPVVIERIAETVRSIVTRTLESSASDFLSAAKSSDSEVGFVNFVATHMPLDPAAKAAMLAKSRISDRAFELLKALLDSEAKLEISQNIMERAKSSMDQNRRNAFLQQQMETIREELYGEADDADELARKAEKLAMPEKVRETFSKEIEKLRRLNPSSPDYSVQYSYLETLIELPWGKYTETNNDFASARSILEAHHSGLEKVKQRILEQLAVLMHHSNVKAPILCLVGPPGVGKTSLGRSVAKALGRKYGRVSFGGLHDEAEIRGHRRTYIGAMPGRIIDAMKRVGSSNPVLVLDEIDKIGHDFKGDPAAALLEVLDPEQNCHFHDNYVDVDYDLSKVLFIATANTLSTIDRPLLDRMEIIDISGYLLEEKVEIARQHLIPHMYADHELDGEEFKITDEALVKIIEDYTAESGVRQLQKQLSSLARKYILASKSGTEFPSLIKPEDLRGILGLPMYNKEKYEGNRYAGVVTGLAWTQVGGEILLAESSLSPGKGDRVTITGNLGDVMKESATIALQWVKAHATELCIDSALFDKYNLHIHFPEGAIPKDGPSAGITIATSIVSTFTQRRVAERVAMTGEITLRGKVLPVGGIKEKILAAKRAGITDIILSYDNRKDVEDIAEKYRAGLTFHYVETVKEVLAIAITDQPVEDALTL